MRAHELFESPVGNISNYGNQHAPLSLNKKDLELVQSLSHHREIRRVLQKAPVDIDLHFVNNAQAQAEDHFDDIHSRLAGTLFGFMTPKQFYQRWGFQLKFNPSALNAVFTDNVGDNAIPFTPWIIAHRLCHAILEAEYFGNSSGEVDILDLPSEVEDWAEKVGILYSSERHGTLYPLKPIIMTIGTTNACRKKVLNGVNCGEIIPEWFAQYLISGRIKLNPLPPTIDVHGILYRFKSSDQVRDQLFHELNELTSKIELNFKKVLINLIGKIVVF